ncbi:MAG TPA: hypothetical protein VMT24_05500, partial [Aggregatilineaceae bacterium]|nr:hypothetical protein [Aggregatilineaceae bacterium]
DVMSGLDCFIKSNGATTGRRFAKSLGGGAAREFGDEQLDADHEREWPDTVQGLRTLIESEGWQQLLRENPDEARRLVHEFIDTAQLVKSCQLTAQQVSILDQLLAALPRAARTEPLAKGGVHAHSLPRPWDFAKTLDGHQGFLHSPEMARLQREHPSRFRHHALDHFSQIEPRPTPLEVSKRRMELEQDCPDDPARSMVAKSVGHHTNLTHGQAIAVANFGPSIGDPSVWLRSR